MKYALVFISWALLFPGIRAMGQQGAKDLMHLQYARAGQNTLDLYLPASYTNKTPVVIMIHGGAWMIGGNEYTRKTSRDLRDSGFIVANVDYRYVSDSVHGKDLLTDIDSAVLYMQKISSSYHFRNSGYVMAGISAGAHLALLYGYTKGRKIRSIGALCPPTRLDDTSTLTFLQKNNLVRNAELLANSRYQKGVQPDKAFTEVSPYAHIKKIPTLLFHGDKDDLVPFEQSKFLYAKLQEKKVRSKLVIMKGKGHDVGMNNPDSEQVVLSETVNWIRGNN